MPAPDPQHDERWIAVATLLRPQGRRGELLCDPLTDLPGVFAKEQTFRLTSDGNAATAAPQMTLEDCWRPQGRNAGRLVLKLRGVDSISAAELLERKQLFLRENALPALEPDTYLVRDLLGCRLYDGEALLGTVVDLQFPIAADGRTRLADAVDLLVVERLNDPPAAEPALVPFVKAWVDSVDTQAKRIAMHLPPGLFDPATADPTGEASPEL